MVRVVVLLTISVSLGAGCLGSGDASLKLKKGSKEESVSLGTVDPLTDGELGSDPLTPGGGTEGELLVPYSLSGSSEILGDKAQVSFLLPNFGLGPAATLIDFSLTSGPKLSPVNANMFVDSWHFTGDGLHPYEIRAHLSDPIAAPPPRDPGFATFDVDFAIEEASFHTVTFCPHEAESQFGVCGDVLAAGDLDKTSFSFTLKAPTGIPSEVAPTGNCSAAIIKPFAGKGAGAKVTSDLGSFGVEGADLKLSCVQTLDTQHGYACGAETSVSDAGCNWNVFAMATPDSALAIGATTSDDKCKASPSCNDLFLGQPSQ